MASAPIARFGGRIELPTGERVVWSVADGRRGRRWREMALRSGSAIRSILLETDPDGRLVRLEMSTAAGLLTIHPAGVDGAIHGNVVAADGVRHLTLGRVLPLVEGSPTSSAVLVAGFRDAVAVGGSIDLDIVRIDDRLEPGAARLTVTRLDEGTWRLVDDRDRAPGEGSDPLDEASGGPRPTTIRLDRWGLPELPGAVRWPLELEPD